MREVAIGSCVCLSAIMAVVFAGVVTSAGAVTTKTAFSVSGMDNIWGSGLTTAPDPGGNGGGVLPFEAALPAGTQDVTFAHVVGTVSFEGGESNRADGGYYPNMNISAYGGISGLQDNHRYFYVVGVFLDGGQPATPPPTLNFTKDFSFTSISPELGQVFFVGDGLSGRGTGTVQRFEVPIGATALYLGFADAPEATGPPGAYGDNSGELTGIVRFHTTS